MDAKNVAYAGGPDVLGNFQRRAAQLGISVAAVIRTDMSKHWDQITHGNVVVDSKETIDTRIDDLMNYMDLLRAAYHDTHVVPNGEKTFVDDDVPDGEDSPTEDGAVYDHKADAFVSMTDPDTVLEANVLAKGAQFVLKSRTENSHD